jgi:curved DNA-binding protein CbpA
MNGANGDALEWAVALLQAPGERHALRLRPLPEGVTDLLGIAAASSSAALAAAAARFLEPEARVREAAQFYVREILLFPNADAYRVMGVEMGVNTDLIKTHHRLLQRWLHPDRLQHAADGIFAARVNAAWQQLRQPAQRARYDAELRMSCNAGVSMTNAGAGHAARVWVPEEPPASVWQRWVRRVPLLLLLGVCGGLLWRIWQEQLPSPGAIEAEFNQSAAIKLPAASPMHRATNPASRSASEALSSTQASAQFNRHIDDNKSPIVDALMVNRTPPSALPHDAQLQTRAGKTVLASPSETWGAQVPAASLPQLVQSRPSVGMDNLVRLSPEAIPPQVAEQHEAPVTLAAAMVMPDEAQIQSAQQTGEQLLRYMQRPALVTPPIWSSPAVQLAAEQMRKSMQANGPLQLGAAQWRIGSAAANMISRFPAQRDMQRGGVFTATLQWREGRWLVTGVGMGQIQ